MKKTLLLIAVLALGISIVSQDLAYGYGSSGNKRGAALWNMDTSAKRGDKKVVTGDSQNTVVQKMGRPDIVTTLNDGTQLWVYSQPVRRSSSDSMSRNSVITPGPSSFNQQIAMNGFGGNMYTGLSQAQMVPVEVEEDAMMTKTTKIKFNADGIVEDLSETTD